MVEYQIVALNVMGSSPVVYPNILLFLNKSLVGEIGRRVRLKIYSHLGCWFESNTKQNAICRNIKFIMILKKIDYLFSIVKRFSKMFFEKHGVVGVGFVCAVLVSILLMFHIYVEHQNSVKMTQTLISINKELIAQKETIALLQQANAVSSAKAAAAAAASKKGFDAGVYFWGQVFCVGAIGVIFFVVGTSVGNTSISSNFLLKDDLLGIFKGCESLLDKRVSNLHTFWNTQFDELRDDLSAQIILNGARTIETVLKNIRSESSSIDPTNFSSWELISPMMDFSQPIIDLCSYLFG